MVQLFELKNSLKKIFSSKSDSAKTPLVIDLDGTLINTDLLQESALTFVLQNPFRIFTLLKWLKKGKAHLKEKIANDVRIDVAHLPYNQAILDLINAERSKGRKIILATASHKIYAEQIAEHLKIFDAVFATEGYTNLSAQKKCDRLVKEFGAGNFDYVGNSCDDLKVWEQARQGHSINTYCCLDRKIKALGNVEKILVGKKNSLKIWAKALRLHQWVKNSLIFVPLLASHKISDIDLIFKGALAFLFFGLCASHVYLFNDLIDLKNDRTHKSKRFRPLAAGLISIPAALSVSFVLLAFSLIGAFCTLPLWFGISLLAYYFLTFAYSLFLKRIMMFDVITLAALYTMRIIAGTFAFELSLTFWMLAFSMFIFLSLSLVKRFTELHDQRSQGQTEIAQGRGYYPSDLEMISSLGAAAGYLSVMILALYIQDQSTVKLYAHPKIIWFACPILLYWISRVWMLAHRGQMHEDPVVFAIKDRFSWVTGILFAIIFWYAA